jgi:hypothetical protein
MTFHTLFGFQVLVSLCIEIRPLDKVTKPSVSARTIYVQLVTRSRFRHVRVMSPLSDPIVANTVVAWSGPVAATTIQSVGDGKVVSNIEEDRDRLPAVVEIGRLVVASSQYSNPRLLTPCCLSTT